MDSEPRMDGQERADFAPAMDRPPIPEQVDRAPEMSEQVLEKRSDVQAAEIPWAAPEVQCHAPALGRHRHATTDGEAIVAIAVANAGGLPARCPRPADIRDEQEAALNRRQLPHVCVALDFEWFVRLREPGRITA